MIRRDSRLAALVAAAALHAAVLALLLFVPSNPAMLPIGSSVPINIVSSEPTDVRPAVQAPQTQAAAAPQPQPQAPPQPPAPIPAPMPSFSRVQPKPPPTRMAPQPTPRPLSSEPTPRPAPPRVEPREAARPAQPARTTFDIDRLQQIIENARRNAGAQASSASRGPARAETAPQARPNAGHALSQSDLAGLSQLLERLWTLQCDIPGVSSVAPFKVRFVVDLNGNLLGPPNAGGLQHASDPIVASVARRALDAVHAVTPLPQSYYGQTVTVNFNAKEACANR